MSLSIRPCGTTDLPTWVELTSTIWPEHPTSIEQLQHDLDTRPAYCRLVRLVAWLGDRPVGLAEAGQCEGSYDPRKFHVDVGVLPECEGLGYGRALFNEILGHVADSSPRLFTGWVREDNARGLRFAADRGFIEVDREFEQTLDLTGLDPAEYAEVFDRLAANQVEIKTLTELRAEEDWERRLWELSCELDRYVPSVEETTDLSLESFRARRLENPYLIADACFVAVCGGQYVGMHNLWRSAAGDGQLEVGITAIQPAHRRKGIALGLKLRGLIYAKSAGVTEMRTWNATHNRPMLSINERLGFVKKPAWIQLHRRLEP